MKKEFTYR